MPIKLTADLGAIRARFGNDFIEQLTYPGIYRGSALNVSPVIIDRDDQCFVIISEADSDACKLLPKNVKTSIYGRYFSWEKDLTVPAETFAAAVRKVTGNEIIHCDPTLPVARYRALADSGPVGLSEQRSPQPINSYIKQRKELEKFWVATRDADARAFEPFLQKLPYGKRLIEEAGATSNGFSPLDTLCFAHKISALYISAPHELELFTGLPAKVNEQFGMSALFIPGSPDIIIYSQYAFERSDFRSFEHYESLGDALAAGNYENIAIQYDQLAIEIYQTIKKVDTQFVDAAYVLKRWQDKRACDDAVYFFVAGNAALYGIVEAHKFYKRHVRNEKLTENDLVAAYHKGVASFVKRYGFKDRVSSYFDIVHAGSRTLLPATAGDYLISAKDKTIKFDMGLTVSDASGCIRGVSDIARTICIDPQLETIHHKLRAILVDELIPAIKPGMSGADIHAIGVALLKPLETELLSLGLLPEGKSVEGYLRDCGHTIQRQTISSVYFLPGVTEQVEQNMLGCTEYVWPIGDVLIAVEDGYFITAEGGIAFTDESAFT